MFLRFYNEMPSRGFVGFQGTSVEFKGSLQGSRGGCMRGFNAFREIQGLHQSLTEVYGSFRGISEKFRGAPWRFDSREFLLKVILKRTDGCIRVFYEGFQGILQ